MTPLERQFELKKLGIKQVDIAKEESVSAMTVSKIIRDIYLSDKTSDRIIRNISKKIGRSHLYVFPKFYIDLEKRQQQRSD